MARRTIIIILLAATLSLCRAQVKQLKPIDEIRTDLKKTQTDFDKANLLLDLALSYVYKPEEYAHDLDTAILLIKEAEKINQRLSDKRIGAKSYFVYSNALREGGKREAGKQFIEKALAIYKTISEPDDMGEAWLELSSYYSIYSLEEEVKMKRECFEQALPLFKAAGNKERQGDVLKNLGDLSQYQQHWVQAMKELHEALAIYSSIGYKNPSGVYDLLGFISSIIGDYSGGVRFGLLAVKTAEQLNDTTIQMCTFYHRLASSYMNWSKFEQALIYSKKAMDFALKYHNSRNAEVVLPDLCRQLSELNKWEEAVSYIRRVEAALKHPWDYYDSLYVNTSYILTYGLTKKYENARKYVDQLVELIKERPITQVVAQYHYLTYYFLGTHQFGEAENYANIYLQRAFLAGDKNAITKAYQFKSRIDSARGDFKSALSNYQLYKSMSDSMLNEAASFQFAQMEVEHETKKKDNDIKILRQQKQIQKAQLVQSRTTNTIVIISIIVLALLMALLYNRYRIKQRHNKEINEKNAALEKLVNDKDVLLTEKDWLIKEIHHRVKNNLQMIISLLNTQSEFLDNPSALDAIRESQEWMQAIALIHQQLYQVDNTTRINVRSYISELVESIRNSFIESERISFQLNVPDINLDVSQSMPLGLILNEAITNSIKYAYPKDEKGSVYISLQYIGAQQLQLRVLDKGKGLPLGFDTDRSNTLGFQLIKLFSEQLDGDLYFINNNGLEIILNFKTSTNGDTVIKKITA